jgi:hypothetical protein
MRKEREPASDGPGALSRVGALGVLLSGALVAAVIMVASSMPDDDVDGDSIPGVVIRSPAGDADADRGKREARRAGPGDRKGVGRLADGPRRGQRAASQARPEGGTRKAVARRDSSRPGDSPERVPSRSGDDDEGGSLPVVERPRGDDDDDGGGEQRTPGTRRAGSDDDDDRTEAPAPDGDGDDDAPPAPAPAPAPPADTSTDDDDESTPSLSGTSTSEGDDDDGLTEGAGSGEADD